MPPTPRQHRIAIVDDHADSRAAVAKLLNALGHDGTAYASAAELITSGRIVDFDCLILDVSMPDIDGLALQRSLYESIYDVPIIFYTGDANPGVRDQALRHGAVAFLIKPVRREPLVEALDQAFAAKARRAKV